MPTFLQNFLSTCPHRAKLKKKIFYEKRERDTIIYMDQKVEDIDILKLDLKL